MENCNLDLEFFNEDRANEDSMKVMEEHMSEKEVSLSRILQLERELDQKKALELEIAQLNGKLKVIETYLQGDEDMHKLTDKLDCKREEENKGLDEFHNTLLMERKANLKLKEAREELTAGLKYLLKGSTLIGTKRKADPGLKPFESDYAKYLAKNVDMKSIESCSSWDMEIHNPTWHSSNIMENDGQMEELDNRCSHFEHGSTLHFGTEDNHYKDLLQHTWDDCPTSGKAEGKIYHDFAQFLQTDLAFTVDSTIMSPAIDSTLINSNSNYDELFLWPWAGMLVNLPMEDDYDLLREQFAEFSPINVIGISETDSILRKYEAVILFNRDWKGFKDAMEFENHFKSKRMGKKEWKEKIGEDLIGIHGWIASEDDYNSNSLLVKTLRKHGELKPLTYLMEKVKGNGIVVSELAKKMDVTTKYLRHLKCRYNETGVLLKSMMHSKAKILKEFNEEMHNVKQKGRETARRNLMDNDKLKLELSAKKNEIEECCRELQKYEDNNTATRRSVDNEIENTALANANLELITIERKRTDEKLEKLVEEHQREKGDALARIHQLERELDQKQILEAEVAQLKSQLKVLEHFQGEENVDEKIEEIRGKIEEDQDGMAELHNTLLMTEHKTNQELNDARAELIQILSKLLKGPAMIGIKRMGDLDIKPFESACKKKYPAEEADMKASELCSSWDEEIRNPSWHPFKIIEQNGLNEEVIDDNDSKLRSLWIDFGDDVHNAVKKALFEINEYNPSGRYPVAEIWNWKEDRKATMKEAIIFIIKQFKTRR